MGEQSVEHWVEHLTGQDMWAQVVARAWADEAFEARLIANPTAVLREAGLDVPEETDVQVHWATEQSEGKATDQRAHLVLPPKPAGTELVVERWDIGRLCVSTSCKFSTCEGPYTPL
jgi:hypothetical protein